MSEMRCVVNLARKLSGRKKGVSVMREAHLGRFSLGLLKIAKFSNEMCLPSLHKVLILSAYCGPYLEVVGGAYREWAEARAVP